LRIGNVSGAVVQQYLTKGLRFGSFYSPEDSDAFARVARRAASEVLHGVVLDLGCGSGIPTIHACGRHHWGLGLDVDESALKLARANVVAAGKRNVAFVASDMMKASGRFALVMSNPPYIPCARGGSFDRALEVEGDGTAVIKAILARYRAMADDFVLHFASICNPQEVVRAAEECALSLRWAELTVAPFGRYTTRPRRLAYLLRCRSGGTAFFHDEGNLSAASARYSQILITVHYSGRKIPKVGLGTALVEILERFQEGGVKAIRRSTECKGECFHVTTYGPQNVRRAAENSAG
jgi:predicted RNA methylase